VGKRMEGSRNADLCAADFCASQAIDCAWERARCASLLFPDLSKDCPTVNRASQSSSKRATASSNGNLPALGGSSPEFHFPMSFLRLFFAAAKDLGSPALPKKPASLHPRREPFELLHSLHKT
jgi:hypothetical protein